MKNLLSQSISLLKKILTLLITLVIVFAGGYGIVYVVANAMIHICIFLISSASLIAGVYMLERIKIK